MKVENRNEVVKTEIEKSIGQTVRLRVNNGVIFTYCGRLDRSGSGYFVSRENGPEVYFQGEDIRAVHCGPTQDMLAILIG